MVKARPNELKVRWTGTGKHGVEIAYGGKKARRDDANWLLGFLVLSGNQTVRTIKELERRGYDVSTMRFSIRKKK